MSGMARTHAFLVPAALQAAGLATDPIALYWAEHALPKNEAPYHIDLGWDAFQGLPSPENRIVWACPLPHARNLINFLARVRFGIPGNTQWDSLHQRLDLVDRQLLDSLIHQPDKPPTVPVDVFGLTGPGGTYFWKPPTNPWKQGLQFLHRGPQTKPRRRPFEKGSTS